MENEELTMTKEEFIEGFASCIEVTPLETIKKGFEMYMEMLSKVENIANLAVHERLRQTTKGYSEELDDKYTDSELALGAITYITYAAVYSQILNSYTGEDISKEQITSAETCAKTAVGIAGCWPFKKEFNTHGTVKDSYIKAIALLIAEIQRIERYEEVVKEKVQDEWKDSQVHAAMKTDE